MDKGVSSASHFVSKNSRFYLYKLFPQRNPFVQNMQHIKHIRHMVLKVSPGQCLGVQADPTRLGKQLHLVAKASPRRCLGVQAYPACLVAFKALIRHIEKLKLREHSLFICITVYAYQKD